MIFECAEDLEIHLFVERYEVPVFIQVVPIGHPNIERVGVEFIEEDPRGSFRVHSLMVLQCGPDEGDGRFDADSFNIRMAYWYHLDEYWDFAAFNEKVNFEIFRAFEDHGIQFSLPFRVTYWATDSEQRPLEVEMVERKEW